MEEAILTRLREILKTSDLEKTTGKSIRKQLEKELSADLSGYKPVIREEIEKYLQGEAIRQSQESAQTTLAASPSKSKGGYGCLLSPELSAFMGGVFECPRTQVVKELWAYIKSKDLQNPKDRRKINLDEELAKLFKPPLTMLNMNKQLSRHCKTDDRKIASRSPAKKAGAAAGGKGKAKKDKKAAKAKQGSKVSKKGAAKISKKKSSSSSSRKPKAEGEKRKGGGGFGSVHVLEPLRSFVGTEEACRTEIVKKIWDYIKANNCKDPKDGRNIVPDSTLGKFLTPPVNMFTMNKQLSQYLQKIPKIESKS